MVIMVMGDGIEHVRCELLLTAHLIGLNAKKLHPALDNDENLDIDINDVLLGLGMQCLELSIMVITLKYGNC